MRTTPLVALVGMILAAPAHAASFTVRITNHSAHGWSGGVLAVMAEGAAPDALLQVGPAPGPGDPTWPSYTFGHATCNDGGKDTGVPGLLLDRWGLTRGVDAWIVPSIAPGQSRTVQFEARAGTVVSYLARVEGSDDDVVAMHAPGDRTATGVPLFNSHGLPLFEVRFDIGGYDLNSVDPADGTAADCLPSCPVVDADCYVAPGNGTVGAGAGGSQQTPTAPRLGVFPGYALKAVEGTFYRNGVGSPTVVYRHLHDDYVMFFETRLPEEDADCPVGKWGIGVAHSTDGWKWQVVGKQPLVRPRAGTYHSCVAAHPTAVIDDAGTDIHLWFKGEQGNNCDESNPPAWGCARYTGVGYVKVEGTQLTKLTSQPPTPFSQNQTYGFPSVTRIDGTWVMVLQRYPSLYLATASAPAGPWTLQPSSALQPGITQWAGTELFNPSLSCKGDTTVGGYPYHLWFGGRTLASGSLIDGGLGEGISNDSAQWFISAAPFRFTEGTDWRHWDAVRVGADDFLVYFSDKDAEGRNRIGLAATADEWDPRDIATRVCPQPAWWP